jgi:hypothetical protein
MTLSHHLRLASPDDARTLDRLAALDSSVAPRGEVVLAFRGTDPVAAVSLTDGHVVADPFVPTADVVRTLRAHARVGNRRRTSRTRRLRLAPA